MTPAPNNDDRFAKRAKTWIRDLTAHPDVWFHVNRHITQADLAVRWGCIDFVAPNNPVHNVDVEFSVLKFIGKGTGKYTTRNMTFDIEPNMVVWALPGEETTLKSDPDNPIAAYVLMLFGDKQDEIFGRYLRRSVGAASVSNPEQIESIFDEIVYEARSTNLDQKESCNLLTRVLFSRIGSCVQLPVKDASEHIDQFKRCEGYIEGNFGTIVSIGEVADAVGISSQQVNRLFDRYSDMTPYQFLSSLRMGEAAALLVETHDPVAKIAKRVGYDDPGLFSRNFRTTHDTSPSEYRKKHQTKL